MLNLKNKRGTMLFIFCLFIVCICSSASDLKEYPCYRLAEEPLLDGKLDSVWSTIPQTEGFVNINTMNYSSKRTEFKVGYNETAIYLYVKCEEPELEKLLANGSDMGPLWNDDSVELYFQTDDDIYYQFIINSKGSKWNGRFVSGKNNTTQLFPWNVAVDKGDDFWSLEVKIPFTTVQGKATGEWRFNIARNIRTSGETSSWSKVQGGFHDPGNFGKLIFKKELLTPDEAVTIGKKLTQIVPNIMKKGELYVGWSEVSITPDKPVKLQGQFHERISQYVENDIVVTVLALESRDASGKVIEQMMIGGCDLGSISASILKEVRESLKGRLSGFDLDKLVLNATHTHTAPCKEADEAIGGLVVLQYLPEHLKPLQGEELDGVMQPDEYREFLVERLCEAFISAWESREKGLLNWQLGHAVVGHNRRIVYDDGRAEMYGFTGISDFAHIEGPVDHGIELLYFWNQAEELTGVAVNVACPSQVEEGQYYVSADYWDSVRKELRARLSPDLFILPLCGASGDQSPRDMIRRGRGEPSMSSRAGAVELGRRIADAVVVKYESAAANKRGKLEFRHNVVKLQLPVRTVSKDDYEAAKAQFDLFVSSKKPGERITTTDISGHLLELAGIMDRYETQQHTAFYVPEIHIIRLGSIAIATNPFELFTDYGLKIKALSQAQQTFVVQLACDKGRYLPTARAAAGGGYSAIVASGIVGPEGGKLLVERTVKEINNLFSVYLEDKENN